MLLPPTEVLAAFKVYYETAQLESTTDPNLVLIGTVGRLEPIIGPGKHTDSHTEVQHGTPVPSFHRIFSFLGCAFRDAADVTVAALVFTPIVLTYTGYTYWVFRKRLGTQNIPAAVPVP